MLIRNINHCLHLVGTLVRLEMNVRAKMEPNFISDEFIKSHSTFILLKTARSHARLIQHVITPELWETINRLWCWYNHKKTRHLFKRNQQAFYRNILRHTQLIYGQLEQCIARDSHYHFMRIGMAAERMHARLCMLQHYFNNTEKDTATLGQSLQLMGAHNMFLRSGHKAFDTESMLRFIMFDVTYPQSILTCTKTIIHALDNIKSASAVNLSLAKTSVKPLLEYLNEQNLVSFTEKHFHEILPIICEKSYSLRKSLYASWEKRDAIKHHASANKETMDEFASN